MSTAELFWILVPALGTAVGGVAILVVGGAVSDRLLDGLMGFTAGVMLAATAFSLLVPALDTGPLWQVLAAFVENPWPGNVRELQNVLQYARIKCQGSIIELEHLPQEVRETRSADPAQPAEGATMRASVTMQSGAPSSTRSARPAATARRRPSSWACRDAPCSTA